ASAGVSPLRQSARRMSSTSPWISNREHAEAGAVSQSDRPEATSETALEAHVLIERLMTIARVSALEEMASGIAHELNQPLGAIATFSQAGERMLSRPEPMTSSALEVLQLINREALNAGEGIRRIRRLFNHSGTKRPPCSMRELVTELRPVLELLAARTGSKLKIRGGANLPLVAVDRLGGAHVLVALVQNAFEAPRRPGAANRVRIEVTSDRYAV